MFEQLFMYRTLKYECRVAEFGKIQPRFHLASTEGSMRRYLPAIALAIDQLPIRFANIRFTHRSDGRTMAAGLGMSYHPPLSSEIA